MIALFTSPWILGKLVASWQASIAKEIASSTVKVLKVK
jgi:hypothetical protein